MIIAIDGPAGSGKSTIAKLIAKRLNLLYIDTGAMYRALTLDVLNRGIAPHDIRSIINLAEKCRIGLENTSGGDFKITLDNADVTQAIRGKEVSSCVSDISKIKRVREIMVSQQRELGRQGKVVLEGRDVGTVVFPEAEFKFFLDANVNVRAKRRYKEMAGKHKITLAEVKENVRNRDRIDSNRDTAPLKKAEDALYIDTTDMSIEEVVEKVLVVIREQLN